MPKGSAHKAQTTFKALNMGPPGGGKTGALATLLKERESIGISQIVVADWDDGLMVLSQLCSDSDLDHLYYRTFRDKLKPTPDGPILDGQPKAYSEGVSFMNNWKEPGIDLGPASKWGPETLFVCDSLTGMGDAAMRWSRFTQGADTKASDWNYTASAMSAQDKYVQLLMVLNCHVIVNSHVRYMGGGGTKNVEDKHGSQYKTEVDSISLGTAYPSALGRQLPPMIGRHFNILLETKIEGTKRIILTKPQLNTPLKAPLPAGFPSQLPAESGLLRIFRQVTGRETAQLKTA